MRSLSLIVLGAAAVALMVWLLLLDNGEGPNPSSTEGPVGTQIPVRPVAGGVDASTPVAGSGTEQESSVPPDASAANRAGLPASTSTPGSSVTGEGLRGLGKYAARVVDPRGKPVAGADVYLAPLDRSGGIALENLDPTRVSWARRSETKTDDLGRFQIAPEAGGSLRLGVRARGFAPHDVALSTSEPVRDLGDIVLQDSVVLVGRVLDTSRRPVAHAALRRLDVDASPASILGGAIGDVVATTDDDGAFRVDALASGPWLLSIRSEGHPDKLERGTTTKPGEIVSGLEFVLADGAEIRGRVVNAPAAALRELWIMAVPKPVAGDELLYGDPKVDEARFLVVPRGARCEPDGSFRVQGVTPDVTWRLAAREGEHDYFGRLRTAWVEARAGDKDVELVYKPAKALVFQVVDAASAEPVTELDVRVGNHVMQPITGDDGRIQRTFAEGRVRSELSADPPAGETFEVVIESPGYETLRVADLRPVEGQDLDLGVLRLARAPRFVVRVLDDATSAPVKRAQVELREVGDAGAHSTGSRSTDAREPVTPGTSTDLHGAQSDADGRAQLNSLPGKSARLIVRHPDYAPSQSATMLLPATGDREETVRLFAGGSVVVEVRDALGAAVRDIGIQHTGPDGELDPHQDSSHGSAATDARGQLRFTHLALGTHTFEVEHAGSDPRQQSRIDVADKSTQTVTLIVPARARLTGRVTESGQPLSGATLRFARASSSLERGDDLDARTNGNGDYTLNGIPMGSYSVNVVHPARAMAFESDVQIDDVQRKFDIDIPLSVIEGRLVDEEDRPVAGIRVRAERAGVSASVGVDVADERSADARVFSSADGSYVLRGVRFDVDLVVQARGGEWVPAQSDVVRVAAGQVKSGVDLKLVAGAALEVTVTRADARSVAACRVRAVNDELQGTSGSTMVATTGASGVARFSGLRPGKWRIQVEANETLPPEQIVDVKRGSPNTAKFELR